MAQEFVWNQFSAGWCPSDDSQNGRKNALLRMDNVELDKNGALSLIAGKKFIRLYDSPAFALFAAIVGGIEATYAATRNGKIWKNDLDTYLINGSDSVAAFSNGIGNVLIASGNERVKDDGIDVFNLGLPSPNVPTLSLVTGNYTNEFNVDGTILQYAYIYNSTSGTSSTPVFSTSGITTSTTLTLNTFQASGVFVPPSWITLPNGGNGTSINQDPSDLINISIIANSGTLSSITQIEFDIGVTDESTTFYGFSVTQAVSTIGTSLNFVFKRGDFQVIPNALNINPTWDNILGFQLIITTSADLDITWSGTIIPIVDNAITTYSTHFAFYNGINQSGSTVTYEYTLVGLNDNGVYEAFSSGKDADAAAISIDVPPGADVQLAYVAHDAQTNFIWVYRRGGDLDQWYRTIVFPNTDGNYIDNINDTTALDDDLILNINTATIQDTTTLDLIYDIVGPMEGRWFYFTTGFIYPSVINDPDLVDISLGIRSCSSNNELLMWAVKVAEGYILVGTSIDIYILSGTFTTLPDGEIDTYYRPMTCQFPPITRQYTFANGLIYYMAMDGWRSIGTDASTSTLMVSPSTDALYKAESRYGYSGVNLTDSPIGTQYFPVVATRNKLFCCVNDRVEVWDFTRQYWKTFNYGLGTPTAITRSVLGIPLIAYGDGSLYYVNGYDTLTSDNEPQTVSILSSIMDPGGALTRNDLYTLKIRLITGEGEQLGISVVTKDNTSYFIGYASSFTDIENEVILDLNGPIPFPTETFQFFLTGQFTQLVISDIRVSYDSRPPQLTALRGYSNNFGTAGKKRLRMWPVIIDTLGNDVFFTLTVDNVTQASQLLNSNEKTTLPIFFNFDAFGIDYGYLITGGPFEFWEMGQPEVVQSLPTPKQYDQVGPQELFRYGKIREIELRLLPNGGNVGTTSELPYTLYFDDYSIYTNKLVVNNGLEQTYSFGIPKGVAGSIIRIELGPTAYSFVRYYLRIKVLVHGFDTTDNSKWISL